MEDLNGPWLFESMYSEDPEASKLAALPGMEELLEGYPFTENNIPNYIVSTKMSYVERSQDQKFHSTYL